jgi:hypothetical protein
VEALPAQLNPPVAPPSAPLSVHAPLDEPPQVIPALAVPQAQLDEDATKVDRLPVDLPTLSPTVAADSTPPRPASAATRGGMARRQLPWLARIGTDAMAALRVLFEAGTIYLRAWQPLLLLVAVLLVPVVATKSCMVAAVTGSAVPSPLVEGSATTVDFSRVRGELTRRVQASQAAGKIDKAALAELTALQAVSSAGAVGAGGMIEVPSGVAVIARWFAAALLTGLLVFGLAVPLAYASLTLALVDQRAGSPLPSFMDVAGLLWRRRLRLVATLLPAAALVAVGSALFVLPGLLAALALLFVPVVVLFERATGKAAFVRSLALVRTDAARVIVVMLAAALLCAVAFGLPYLVMPDSSRRIIVFLHDFLGDLVMIVTLPVPALAAARLYIDLRGREGVNDAALAEAARR